VGKDNFEKKIVKMLREFGLCMTYTMKKIRKKSKRKEREK
jgi:hypothetical protein